MWSVHVCVFQSGEIRHILPSWSDSQQACYGPVLGKLCSSCRKLQWADILTAWLLMPPTTLRRLSAVSFSSTSSSLSVQPSLPKCLRNTLFCQRSSNWTGIQGKVLIDCSVNCLKLSWCTLFYCDDMNVHVQDVSNICTLIHWMLLFFSGCLVGEFCCVNWQQPNSNHAQNQNDVLCEHFHQKEGLNSLQEPSMS